MQDTIYTGAIAGISGGLVKLTVGLSLYVIGVAETTILHQAAFAFLPEGAAINSAPALVIGLVVHSVLAALLGVIGVYILRLTGLLYGGLLWVVVYGDLAAHLVPLRLLRPDLATVVTMLFNHLAFGLTTFYAAGRLRAAAA
ncbi:MAG: hypothetical protein AB1500_04360 [Bacillota bacterium]